MPGEIEHGLGRQDEGGDEDWERDGNGDGNGCGERYGDVRLDDEKDERIVRLRALLPNLTHLRLQHYPTHGGASLLDTLLTPSHTPST